MDTGKKVTLADIMKFFGMPIGTFRREWAELSEEAKTQIRDGIQDGTYTYG